MRFLIKPLLVLVPVLFLAAVPAHATCGSAYCFLDTESREGLRAKGAFSLDLSFQYIDQSRKRAGSDSADEVLAPKVSFEEGELEPDHHREIRTLNTLLRLDAAYGVSDRLSVFLHLPLVNDRDHEHFDEVGTPDEFFSQQDGSSGFGDAQLGLRFGLRAKPVNLLVGSFAVKLPTGSHTQRDSEGAINEPTIQPGTGTVDLSGAIRWSHPIVPRRFETFASASYRLNSENDLDYELGDESVLSGGFRHRLDDRWTWSLQLNARHTDRDAFLGEDVPATGADLVHLSPGLQFDAPSGAAYYTFFQYPVYQDVNESQLTPRAGIVVGVSKTF